VAMHARQRGAIIRPLGDTVVLMPPPAISKSELVRLVEITAAAIAAAAAEADGGARAASLRTASGAQPAGTIRAA